MSAHSTLLSQAEECALCDGPCKHPRVQAPVHERYPFMTPDQIAATQPAEPEPEPSRPRAKRRAQDRMARSEHHDRTTEDRSPQDPT